MSTATKQTTEHCVQCRPLVDLRTLQRLRMVAADGGDIRLEWAINLAIMELIEMPEDAIDRALAVYQRSRLAHPRAT